jgi:hypothetical protein
LRILSWIFTSDKTQERGVWSISTIQHQEKFILCVIDQFKRALTYWDWKEKGGVVGTDIRFLPGPNLLAIMNVMFHILFKELSIHLVSGTEVVSPLGTGHIINQENNWKTTLATNTTNQTYQVNLIGSDPEVSRCIPWLDRSRSVKGNFSSEMLKVHQNQGLFRMALFDIEL